MRILNFFEYDTFIFISWFLWNITATANELLMLGFIPWQARRWLYAYRIGVFLVLLDNNHHGRLIWLVLIRFFAKSQEEFSFRNRALFWIKARFFPKILISQKGWDIPIYWTTINNIYSYFLYYEFMTHLAINFYNVYYVILTIKNDLEITKTPELCRLTLRILPKLRFFFFHYLPNRRVKL